MSELMEHYMDRNSRQNREISDLRNLITEMRELLEEWRELGYLDSGGYGGTLPARTDDILERTKS